MVNDISVKVPSAKTTYMLDLHIHGKVPKNPKSLGRRMMRD